ncbi:MAG: Tat pathway signal protein [Phycisphaerae bacterium]|nr:Tat pathway signal protein [Phycisphaerae bacterium]
MIWSVLIHLSYNMWEDHPVEARHGQHGYMPDLCFDEKLWDDVLKAIADAGMNMVVLDLGDAVQYESHPEIAVKGAWTPARLKKELARIRKLGIEPIPKLNFATTHDAWLAEYARCVSTERYYAVCRDLIAEAITIFDKPRLFHLGMDEETAEHQRNHHYAVVRQGDLWWHDFLFLVEQVEKGGVRSWIWSDYVWHHPELFFARMPKSVLQSNWYYGTDFGDTVKAVKAYRDLESHGYDQMPTGSNHSGPENFGKTVEYCARHIPAERLLGFFQTVWRPMIEPYRENQIAAVQQVGEAKAAFRRGSGV